MKLAKPRVVFLSGARPRESDLRGFCKLGGSSSGTPPTFTGLIEVMY